MNSRFLLTTAVACALAVPVHADFSYEQSSKITGGMMAGMMKVAGVFSKTAREPMRSTVLLKGDRMATITANQISIFDLSRELFITIDPEKKTYSEMTFADMQRAMDQMAQKMSQQRGQHGEGAEVSFRFTIDKPGITRTINGLNTQEAIAKLMIDTKDPKTGNVATMTMVSDMFLAPKVPGYEEVRQFYERMAKKMAYSPMGRMAAMMGAGSAGSKGFAEMSKEVAKLDGIPVYQVMRLGAAGQDISATPGAAPPDAGQPAPAGPSGSDVATSAGTSVASSRMGRLGGIAGGLGGFGRKKKQQEEQQAPPPEQGAAPQGQASGLLMEVTSETTNFSSAPVDASKFEVPAGFKKVQNELEKQLK